MDKRTKSQWNFIKPDCEPKRGKTENKNFFEIIEQKRLNTQYFSQFPLVGEDGQPVIKTLKRGGDAYSCKEIWLVSSVRVKVLFSSY